MAAASRSHDLFTYQQPQRAIDIDTIHTATAIYTTPPECHALLAALDWPACGGRLLDPGAGDGSFLLAAIERLSIETNDISALVDLIRGYEFHPVAASAARSRIQAHLANSGWTISASRAAAASIIEERDFLLETVPVGHFRVIAANPPYLRRAGLPIGYRDDFDFITVSHARADLLHAYIQRAADILPHDGLIGAITSDRWLFNQNAAALRADIGQRFSITAAKRLDAASAFYRPKSRSRGTPPRVHPVAIVLSPDSSGRSLSAAPFALDGCVTNAPSIPLSEIADIRLAPWLGPDGIFTVRDPNAFPGVALTPCVVPSDVHPSLDTLAAPSRWAIPTTENEPPPAVLAHLDRELARMPLSARRTTRWLPPEPFTHRFPLNYDAVLIPRIARRLRAIPLPAGVMPIKHQITVASSNLGQAHLIAALNHPSTQAHANQISLRLENGFKSFTTTMLRRLQIPLEFA